jgi:hypothetical protein
MRAMRIGALLVVALAALAMTVSYVAIVSAPDVRQGQGCVTSMECR